MSSSAFPACLAATSWHMVIIDESLAILIICPFCPTFINSKLPACYAPYRCRAGTISACHAAVDRCITVCQQKKNVLSLHCPLIQRLFFTVTVCQLKSAILFNLCHHSVLWSLSVPFLFCPSVCFSHSKASAKVPDCILSCLRPFIVIPVNLSSWAPARLFPDRGFLRS